MSINQVKRVKQVKLGGKHPDKGKVATIIGELINNPIIVVELPNGRRKWASVEECVD